MLDRTLSANVHTNEARILIFVYEISISTSIAARLSLAGISLLLRPSYIRIGDYSNIKPALVDSPCPNARSTP